MKNALKRPDTACCPACGAALKQDGKTRIDLDDNYIEHNGRVTFLTATMAEILFILHQKAPGVVTNASLVHHVYGQGEGPQDADAVIKVQISKANKKIAGLGLAIENSWGRGYALRPLKKQAA